MKMQMKGGAGRNGKAAPSSSKNSAKKGPAKGFRLDAETLITIHDRMLKARCMEEREIKMYKQNDGYFWIGGPGEEAFNIPLGMNVHKGEGKDFDMLHLHYRSLGILVGMDVLHAKDAFRQMKNTAMDPFSGGRNFSNHFSMRKWNIPPITSTIETQYAAAIGSGVAHRRHGGEGITIVNGGDAGTAEGEFASCLIWASRPGSELPILMIVTNNCYGISTKYDGQHGETQISDRAKAFNIKSRTINGNDVEESWFALQEAMEYIRTKRKPYFIESRVSRLYGHSSATGCNFVEEGGDCLAEFEKKLEKSGVLTRKEMDAKREAYTAEFLEYAKEVREEPLPDASTIYDHVYKGQKGKYW